MSKAYISAGQKSNKDWWDQNPMTYTDWKLPQEQRLPKDPNDFAELNARYLDENPFLIEFFKRIDLAGKQVLDIGTGFGSSALNLEAIGANVTAIDLSDNAVCFAARNLELNGQQKSRVIQMDAENLAFDDGTFDYLYSWGVIHHSEHTEKAVSEISRVLKPGAGGLIMVYNRNSLRYWVRGLYWLIIKAKIARFESIDKVQRYFTDGYYHTHYTPREFRDLLGRYSLQATTISITHMSKRYVPLVPKRIDDVMKSAFGWLLVVEFTKQADRRG